MKQFPHKPVWAFQSHHHHTVGTPLCASPSYCSGASIGNFTYTGRPLAVHTVPASHFNPEAHRACPHPFLVFFYFSRFLCLTLFIVNEGNCTRRQLSSCYCTTASALRGKNAHQVAHKIVWCPPHSVSARMVPAHKALACLLAAKLKLTCEYALASWVLRLAPQERAEIEDLAIYDNPKIII